MTFESRRQTSNADAAGILAGVRERLARLEEEGATSSGQVQVYRTASDSATATDSASVSFGNDGGFIFNSSRWGFAELGPATGSGATDRASTTTATATPSEVTTESETTPTDSASTTTATATPSTTSESSANPTDSGSTTTATATPSTVDAAAGWGGEWGPMPWGG